jgi:hypothetical protein
MKPERPTSILVIAILHLIGGSLGLILVVCGGVQLAMQNAAANQPGAQNDPGVRFQQYLDQQAPSAQAVNIANLGVSLVMGIMLLAAGIGLLSMRGWARWVSVVYAGISISEKIFLLVYNLVVIFPVYDAFFAKEAANLPPGMPGMMRGIFIGSLIFQTVLVIYPITVAIIMLKPSTGRAFAEAAAGGRRDREEDEGWGGRGDDRDERDRYDDRPRYDRWGEQRDDYDRGRPDDHDRDRYR